MVVTTIEMLTRTRCYEKGAQPSCTFQDRQDVKKFSLWTLVMQSTSQTQSLRTHHSLLLLKADRLVIKHKAIQHGSQLLAVQSVHTGTFTMHSTILPPIAPVCAILYPVVAVWR
eukprot:scaffold191817_cov18-Tisochrysis_lutea.AAC.1